MTETLHSHIAESGLSVPTGDREAASANGKAPLGSCTIFSCPIRLILDNVHTGAGSNSIPPTEYTIYRPGIESLAFLDGP